MPYAPVNGIDLYYETHGSGPPVVFAHGAGGNHAIWYQQVPFFSRFYQVITFDHRNFGHSDDTNELGRGAFVDDLSGLLDHLGIDKASLVAQSMGGGSCMGLTARSPERVSALVMADTIAGITLPEPYQTRQQQHTAKMREASQLERVVSKGLPQRDPAKAELYLQVASFNKDNANRLNRTQSQPLTTEQIDAAGRKVPVLFLVGSEDALLAPEIVRVACQQVPTAEFVEVQGSGHSVYFEQPAVFNHVVHSFLSKALARE